MQLQIFAQGPELQVPCATSPEQVTMQDRWDSGFQLLLANFSFTI